VENYSDDGRNLQFKQHGEQKRKQLRPPAPPPQEKDENGVYRIGNGVKAPVSFSTPEPDYTDVARSAKFQATNVFEAVIDENGKVASLQLIQPAGLGLDENALLKLQTWTFRPATKDGRPVKVRLLVEVSFNLY
jgi:TonB family protein